MAIDEQAGLLGIDEEENKEVPLTKELTWLRQRIGKFVEGGIYLIAGQPGIGKSTLGIQLALDLGRQNISTLFILTEQSKSELANRARLIASNWTPNDLKQAMSLVQPEDGIYDMANLPSFLSHQVISQSGRYHGVKLIVVDSIQGHGLAAAATKQYRQIYEFCRNCKSDHITTLLVAHVTKKGEIAGPKDLEHNVDCVLYMRKALVYRPLFVPKNRYGPAVLQPIPLEMDRKTTALVLSPHSQVVSSVAKTFYGKGTCGNAEAQAAVALPAYGSRGQITAPGLPRKEIEQLLSCISQIPDMDIGDLSYTIQCRLPGERRYRRLLDLPLSMALIASYLQRDIPGHHLYIGELDLLRRVREVPDNIVQELWEAIEAGEIKTPIRIFCPKESAQLIREGGKGATVVACERLEDAIYGTWDDLKPGSKR
jgi:DNA repair protein RadA/Sms